MGGWLVGWLVCWWLVSDHLLLRDFGPYAIIFMTVYVVITASTAMLMIGLISQYSLLCDYLPVTLDGHFTISE
jgi:hypothetical protein